MICSRSVVSKIVKAIVLKIAISSSSETQAFEHVGFGTISSGKAKLSKVTLLCIWDWGSVSIAKNAKASRARRNPCSWLIDLEIHQSTLMLRRRSTWRKLDHSEMANGRSLSEQSVPLKASLQPSDYCSTNTCSSIEAGSQAAVLKLEL